MNAWLNIGYDHQSISVTVPDMKKASTDHLGLGNLIVPVEWSRERWRHMTLKDQGRDTDTFEA